MKSRLLATRLIHAVVVCGLVFAPVAPALAAVTTDITVHSKPFKIGNEEFQVIQDQDFRGRITREMIVSPSYVEFTSDPNGSGQHEIWELSAPAKGLSVRARVPIAGKYSILEIEKKRQGGTLLMTFTYMPKRNLYELTGTRFTQDHRQFAQSLVVDQKDASGRYIPACVDPTGIQTSASAWLDIVQKLSAGGTDSARQTLQCYMNRYQNAVFGPGCQSAAFKDGMEKMRAGMIDVLLSANQTQGSDRYMQCLSDQGFSTHATRMEAGFKNLGAQLMEIVEKDTEMTAAKGDPAKLAALCKQPSPVTELPGRSVPPVDCVPSDSDSEAAEYVGGLTDQVIFHQTPAQVVSDPAVAKEFESTPATNTEKAALTQNFYGSYFFHELLHRSQIDDETVVYALQNCCDGRPGDHSGDCAKAQKISGDQTLADRYNSTFAGNLPGYSTLEAKVEQGFGSENAKSLMHAYFNGFESHKETAQSNYNQCVARTSGTCDQTCKDACSKSYLDEVAKFSKDFFNDPKYCAAYYKKAQDPKVVTCSQIADEMSSVLTKSGSSTTAGQAEAVHEAVETPKGNPTQFQTNAVLPGAGQISQISQAANAVTPNAGDVKQAANSNYPPAVRLGDANAAGQRYNNHMPILNTANSLAQRVGDAILPKAYANFDSSDPAPSGKSNYRPAANQFTTNNFGGSSRITLNPEAGFTSSLAGLGDLHPNAGGPVAAAAIASSAQAASYAAGGGVPNPAAEEDAATPASGKAHGRETNGARGERDHTPRGLGRASAIDPSSRGPTATAGRKQESAVDFSTLTGLRRVITGDYMVVHDLLTGSHQSEFRMALIDRQIKIVDKNVTYGVMKGREVYSYCKTLGRLAADGKCP